MLPSWRRKTGDSFLPFSAGSQAIWLAEELTSSSANIRACVCPHAGRYLLCIYENIPLFSLNSEETEREASKYSKPFIAARGLIRLNNLGDLAWAPAICSHVMPTNKSPKQGNHGNKTQCTLWHLGQHSFGP